MVPGLSGQTHGDIWHLRGSRRAVRYNRKYPGHSAVKDKKARLANSVAQVPSFLFHPAPRPANESNALLSGMPIPSGSFLPSLCNSDGSLVF